MKVLKSVLDAARNVKRQHRLRKIGNGSLNVIDVGSSGDLPSPWRENLGQIGHLLLFDPLETASETRRKGSPITAFHSALWDGDDERDFYIHGEHGGGSSLFHQNVSYVREHFDELSQKGPKAYADTWFERSSLKATYRVKCRTLDGVLAEINQPFPYHMLKVDTQGAEYRILSGAREYLSRECLALHLELFTLPLYEGIALLPEVRAYLDALGFELAIQFPAHGTFDSQHDCLFLKRHDESDAMQSLRAIYGLGASSNQYATRAA